MVGRWRTIRDNYVRYLRKQNTSSKKVKVYIYGDLLSFLPKHNNLRFTTASLEDDIKYVPHDEELEDEIETAYNCVNEKINTPAPINSGPSPYRERFDAERSLMDYVECHMPRRNPLEEDEDLAFFYSLLSSVRSLNTNQKFTFRLQTMQLLQKLKNMRTPHRSVQKGAERRIRIQMKNQRRISTQSHRKEPCHH